MDSFLFAGILYPMMQTSRLRLYTRMQTYARMLQDACGAIKRDRIARAERMIAEYCGARHAVLTSMGRMAIYEGLRVLPVRGEILLSPITVPEVISLVHAAGFVPVFCDVAPGTWNMDMAQAESLITPKTVAIMTTHFFGNTNTAVAARALAHKHNLIFIEDAAQALGAKVEGRQAGAGADFSILSFSYPKNVTSFYGGCLLTNRDDIAEAVRKNIADYPEAPRRWLRKMALACAIKDVLTWPPFFQVSARVIRYGVRHNVRWILNTVSQDLQPGFLDEIPARYQSRITQAQAAAVMDKWPQIEEDADHRIACAAVYHRLLSDIPGLIIAPFAEDRSHTYLYYPIQAEDKLALQRHMIEQGCDVGVQYAPNCADLPLFSAFARDCPNARAAYRGTVILPTYRGFPLAQAERYAMAVRSFFDA